MQVVQRNAAGSATNHARPAVGAAQLARAQRNGKRRHNVQHGHCTHAPIPYRSPAEPHIPAVPTNCPGSNPPPAARPRPHQLQAPPPALPLPAGPPPTFASAPSRRRAAAAAAGCPRRHQSSAAAQLLPDAPATRQGSAAQGRQATMTAGVGLGEAGQTAEARAADSWPGQASQLRAGLQPVRACAGLQQGAPASTLYETVPLHPVGCSAASHQVGAVEQELGIGPSRQQLRVHRRCAWRIARLGGCRSLEQRLAAQQGVHPVVRLQGHSKNRHDVLAGK